MKRILSGLILISAFALSAGNEFVLVKNGKANCRIQGVTEPDAQEFLAVNELQKYIKKVSGANVIRNTVPGVVFRTFRKEKKDVVEIYPVTLARGKMLLPAKVKTRLAKEKNPDAYYICGEDRPTGKTIFIAAKGTSGVLYGTYAFIEKYLGVRFFHAGKEGEYTPKKKTIILPGKIDLFKAPWVTIRNMSCWSGSVAPWKMEDVDKWRTKRAFHWNINHNYNDLSRARLDHAATGGRTQRGGGHLTFEIAVPQFLFKDHPEFFPLQKGKRICKPRSQRCLTHPEVRKRVVDTILQYIAYNATYCINFHDSTDGWCECAPCRKYGTGNDGKFSLSNYAHRFTAEVADEVYKKAPHARLSFLSYSDYRTLPTRKISFDPRLNCVFCPHQRCYVHALDDKNAECNAPFRQLFMEWRKLAPKIGIFDYYAYSQSPYTPMEYTLAKDMKFYKKMGIHSFLEDCTNKALPIPGSNWQFYYLLSKLMWDADLDVEKEMEEAYTLYYGPAAKPMKKYHALRRALWESAPGHAMYGGGKRYGECLRDEKNEKRLLSLLTEGEKLAKKDSVISARIAMDKSYLYKFWIPEGRKLRKLSAGARQIPVKKLSSSVKIDGKLDEESWRTAGRITNFRALRSNKEAAEETLVRVLYDKDAWYIGIEAMTEHAWVPLKADVRKRDGNVWGDDSCEVFILPPGSGDYYHLIVNSIGTLYDAKVRNCSYDYKGSLAVSRTKEKYVIEMRIPISPMGRKGILDGENWKLHFARTCRNLQPPASKENSSLNGIPPHEGTLFLSAAMGTSVLANGDFSLMDAKSKAKGVLFPANWGKNGAVYKKEGGKGYLALGNVIWSYLRLPSGKKTVIKGFVKASGKGTLELSLSGCIRKKGDKRPFSHTIGRKVAAITLKDGVGEYPVSFETEADSRYYFYARAKGKDIKIYSINLSR